MATVKISEVSVSIDSLDKESAGRIAADAIERHAHLAMVTHRQGAYAVDVHFGTDAGAGALVTLLQFIAEKVHGTSLDEVLRAPGNY
jgi:hypothetical protein